MDKFGMQRRLNRASKRATIQETERDCIIVQREDLEQEHSNLIERLHQLRRLLGYPPLMTGKQRRKLAE